jgi:hypothetical protein
MGKKTFSEWKQDGFTLFSDSDQPYYIIGFTKAPIINKRSLLLASGHKLSPNDTLAYLGGKKTSAGFDALHPIAPFCFKYVGMFSDEDDDYVLWEATGASDHFGKEFESVYYGHSAVIIKGTATALIYTNRAGAGRVIEADIFYSSHENIPLELYPVDYQKTISCAA